MSRRAPAAETQFGSDSFLDVLANMVGILIILIVLAGLRVSRSPLPTPIAPPETPLAESAEPDLVPPLAFEAEPAEPVEIVAEPEEEPLPSLAPVAPPSLLVTRVEQLERERTALRSRSESMAAELAALKARLATLEGEGRAGDAAVQLKTAEIKDKQREVERAAAELAEQQRTVSGLLAEFETAKNARPPSQKVTHRITPVSRTVQGKELHFRLIEGRISQVPVEALEERLKSQLVRQKEWLAKFRTHQGTVGPVGGYSMNYLVERMSLSTVEQMRHGTGMYRLTVAMWKIVPEPDLETESLDEALRAGSRFHQAVNEMEPGSSLTLWVYPDSFPEFRALQQACHKQGFQVSGRPLPEGVPIAGSPQGSRSAGQ